jgi:hypothetical protein
MNPAIVCSVEWQGGPLDFDVKLYKRMPLDCPSFHHESSKSESPT